MKGKILLLALIVISGSLFLLLKPGQPLDKSVVIDKIVVEKGKRKLHIYSKGQLMKTYRISIGRNPKGAKEVEGDRKTPEGLYYINDKNPNSGYYKNLGISYPNKHDIEHAAKLGKKPGGLIKIHGLNNKRAWFGRLHLLKDWTFGCIALTNREIDELYATVKIGTPIEIKP